MSKKHYNANQNPDNTLQVFTSEVGCCGSDTLTVCSYRSAAINLGSVSVKSISIDGTVYPFSANQNTEAGIRAEIKAAMTLAGYGDIQAEGVRFSGTTAAKQVHVIGEATIDKLVNSSDADVAVTELCGTTTYCDFTVSGEGTLGQLVYDGTGSALDNDPYDYTGTPATDTTTAATLRTDIISELTALSVTYQSVTVTPDTDLQAFVIVIRGTIENLDGKLLLGVKAFSRSNCYQEYTAA